MPSEKSARRDHSINHLSIRPVIYRFDEYLSRRYGIFEFSDDKDCILRLQQTCVHHRLSLPGRVIQAGSPVIEMHLMNDRIPKIPLDGTGMGWAAHTYRMFFHSLRLAAAYIKADQNLAKAQAFGGITSVFGPDPQDSGAKFIRQAGFTVMPYFRPMGSFGEFWENFYSWWLIWAYNPASVKGLGLTHMRRAEMWIEMGDFLSRYAEG
jgi:hypothetical protein